MSENEKPLSPVELVEEIAKFREIAAKLSPEERHKLIEESVQSAASILTVCFEMMGLETHIESKLVGSLGWYKLRFEKIESETME